MKESEINRTFRDPTADSVINGEGGHYFGPNHPKTYRRRIEGLIHYAEVYEARKQRRFERRKKSKGGVD